MNYSRLTRAEYPRGKAPTPLRSKVAGTLCMVAFWALFGYTIYQWSITP